MRIAWVIGALPAFSAGLTICTQTMIMRLLEPYRRTRSLAVTSLIGALGYTLLALAGFVPHALLAPSLFGITAICSRKRVARLREQLGLSSQVKRSHKPTTRSDPRARFAPNLLNRQFSAQEPNSKWVTDTKGVETAEAWLYLAVVLDLFSQMVEGEGSSSK